MRAEIVRAARLTASGQAKEAIRILTPITIASPRDADAWRELGRAFVATGRDKDALDALTKSTWIIGRDLGTWVTMASIAERLGLHKDAISYWESALSIEPALFQRKPELVLSWKRSREHYNDFEARIRRLRERDDLAATWIVLDAVVYAGDAAIALQYLERDSPSRPAQFAVELLRVVLGEEAALDSAFDLVLRQGDDGEALAGRTFRWLAKLLPRADAAIANGLARRPNRILARVACQMMLKGDEAQAVGVRILACGVLAELKLIDIAA